MKWFKHDSNAHIDAKLKKVKHKYGIVGYGLYWYCIELIAMGVDKNNITFELEEDSETISLEWNLDQLKVQEIMEYMVHLNLFELQSGRVTCMKLAKRLDDTNSKNPEIRRLLGDLSGSDSSSNEPNESELVGDSPNESAQIRLDKIRLDKKREQKEFKKEIEDLFTDFWKVYPNRVGKSKALSSWKNTIKTSEQAQLVINHVKTRAVFDAQWIKDGGQYVPLPATFINQQRWEDEYKRSAPIAVTPNRKPLPRAGAEQ